MPQHVSLGYPDRAPPAMLKNAGQQLRCSYSGPISLQSAQATERTPAQERITLRVEHQPERCMKLTLHVLVTPSRCDQAQLTLQLGLGPGAGTFSANAAVGRSHVLPPSPRASAYALRLLRMSSVLTTNAAPAAAATRRSPSCRRTERGLPGPSPPECGRVSSVGALSGRPAGAAC